MRIAVKLKPWNGSQHLCHKWVAYASQTCHLREATSTVCATDPRQNHREQLIWVESQVKPFRNKSDVIRDLIDLGIQGVDADAKLSAYHVGAGRPQGNSRPLTGTQPSPKQPLGVAGALQIQQSLPQPTTVVPVPAQKIEDEKNTINIKNEKKARKTRAKRPQGLS